MSAADGGPAFPVPGLQQNEEFNGMSLRDYLAAQAMAHVSWYACDMEPSAALCYKAADAMLRERAK